jgi:hypothetical protein
MKPGATSGPSQRCCLGLVWRSRWQVCLTSLVRVSNTHSLDRLPGVQITVIAWLIMTLSHARRLARRQNGWHEAMKGTPVTFPFFHEIEISDPADSDWHLDCLPTPHDTTRRTICRFNGLLCIFRYFSYSIPIPSDICRPNSSRWTFASLVYF